MSERSGRSPAVVRRKAEATIPRVLPGTQPLDGKSRKPLILGEVLTSELVGRQLSHMAVRQIRTELERQVADRTSQLAEANAALQAQVEQLIAERQSLLRALHACDHERRLIAYELHDGVSQQLLGAKMLFESHQRSLESARSNTGTAYQQGLEALTRAVTEIRNFMNRRRRPVLDREGLVAAIAELGIQLQSLPGAPTIEFRHAVGCSRLEPILEDSLFRIAQEGMNNACRHSGSNAVRVTLTHENGKLTLEVRDWGVGFDLAAVRKGRLGLESLRERARLLGGQLVITSRPGQGTRVRATFPLGEFTGAAVEDHVTVGGASQTRTRLGSGQTILEPWVEQ